MSKLIEHKNFPFCFILFICALFFLRYPSIFTEPRFYAEEGTVYFKFALEHTWLETLTTSHMGYYSLFNVVSSLAAVSLVSMENAPAVTTFLSALVQLAPFIIIFFGTSKLWQSAGSKLVVSLIVLFVGHSAEMWMNTLNSQFHLSLITFLLLFEDISKSSFFRKSVYVILVTFAGLTGVTSCILAPLYIRKAVAEKSRIYIVMSLILVVSLVLQIYLLYDNFGEVTAIRLNKFDPTTFTAGLVGYNFIAILSGWFFIPQIVDFLSQSIVYSSASLVIMLSCLYFLTRNLSVDNRYNLIGSYLIISIISTYFSIRAVGGMRYAYSTNVILMITILYSLKSFDRKFIRRALTAIICWSVTINLIMFFGMYFISPPNWPIWKDEVKQWRTDKSRKLTVHPPHWNFTYNGQ